MLRHPRTLATFSDSGAHVCQEMGSSLQTHLLSYWVRRSRRLHARAGGAEADVRQRGGLGARRSRPGARPGYRADLVLFDEDARAPAMPTVETDLPGGARRLVQKAEGIAATIVNGQVTLENGEATGTCRASCSEGRVRARSERVDRTAELGRGTRQLCQAAGHVEIGAPGGGRQSSVVGDQTTEVTPRGRWPSQGGWRPAFSASADRAMPRWPGPPIHVHQGDAGEHLVGAATLGCSETDPANRAWQFGEREGARDPVRPRTQQLQERF